MALATATAPASGPSPFPPDLFTEPLYPLGTIARLLAADGHRVAAESVRRWVVCGQPTRRGRVYLDAVRADGEWLTSREAVARYAAALAGGGVA